MRLLLNEQLSSHAEVLDYDTAINLKQAAVDGNYEASPYSGRRLTKEDQAHVADIGGHVTGTAHDRKPRPHQFIASVNAALRKAAGADANPIIADKAVRGYRVSFRVGK